MKELEETINRVPCDVVISATPIDLRKFIKVNKPMVAVSYELKEIHKTLREIIRKFLKEKRMI